MSNTNTGGSAFPFTDYDSHGDVMDIHSGMTLRDYFAANAMQAIITNSDQASIAIDEVGGWVGKYAYEVADSMLKARSA
jgi:hypothetical protein